ncbi:MAG TPA: 50S ribosomal protein L25/general stress protein Ctc [Alphaproteobacteria bacterium]|nr:50S ribosomal protein L25/general stress protein Ctc [Alphaproteobacteria bacterium]
MADIMSLPARARDRAGKGAARSTRRAGLVPGVVYGNNESPLLIAMEPRHLEPQVKKGGFFTRVFNLDIDGKQHRVLPRDVQFHPVTDRAEHVDFLRVSATTLVHVAVPVHFTNEGSAPGIKKGGVLNIVRHTIDVACRADAIPASITIDLTGREIGDSIHISHIALPEGVKPVIRDRDFTVATIAPPTVQAEEAPGAAAAAAAAPAAGAAAPAAGAAAPAGGAPAAGAKAEAKPAAAAKPAAKK